MERTIHPFIIEEQKVRDYYEILLDKKFKLTVFDKKKDSDIYKFFLPGIRNLIFWTFNLTSSNINGANKKEFNNLSNEFKATVCKNYYCNIFEKNDTQIVCFNDGICFAIGSNEKEINQILKYQRTLDMEKFNLRNDDTYILPNKYDDNNEMLYLYIIELYKMIFLNKTQKDITNPNRFNYIRIKFVNFTEQIYNIRITDNEDAIKQIEKWDKEFELEKINIKIDNLFDLLYKNNKIDESNGLKSVCIVMCVAAIIVGILNLWITVI